MTSVLRDFTQGCLVTVPLAVTLYVLHFVFSQVDAALPADLPALAVLVAITVIATIGYLSSSLLGRAAVSALEGWVQRVPFAGPGLQLGP